MRQSNYVVLAIGLILLLNAFGGAQPVPPIVNVTTHGATPDDPSNDDRPGIQAAIDIALKSSSPSVTVLFPPGTYHVTKDTLAHTAIAVYTTAADPQITLKGYGACLTVKDAHSAAILVFKKPGTVIEGLTIRHDPLPFTQGIVTQVINSQTIDVEIDAGLPLPNGSVFTDSSLPDLGYADVREPSGRFRVGMSTFNAPASAPVPLGGRMFRYSLTNALAAGTAVGDRFLHTATNRRDSAIGLLFSEDCILRDLVVRAANTFVFGGYQSSMTMTNCRVFPEDGMILSSGYDCIHFSGGRNPNTIRDCVFAGCNDDLLNFHTKAMNVRAVQSVPNGIQATVTLWASVLAGDSLQQLRQNGTPHGNLMGNITVVSAGAPYELNGERVVDIVLPPSTNVVVSDWFFNRALGNPGSVVERVSWTGHRGGLQARGIGTTVKDCQLIHNSAGILLDATGNEPPQPAIAWGEGPRPENISFERIMIADCAVVTPANVWGRACFYAKNAINLSLTDVTVSNGRLLPAMELEGCTGLQIDRFHAYNTAAGQNRYQILLDSSCTGQLVNSVVAGLRPLLGPYSGPAGVALSGNSW